MTIEVPSAVRAKPLEGLGDLIGNCKVVLLAGPGGVGKTSSAAAIAVGAALSGVRTCVVTIDPAKRLADALGIEHIGNDPVEIEAVGAGKLWAVMLDADATFDELVVRYAKSEEQAGRILSNRVYQNLTRNLSGVQEYMAMEKLFELHNDPRFELLVVDTPPSANALDFLDAPRRLISFLDNRVFRLIMRPGPALLRPVSFAARAVLKTISRVVGAEVVDEAVAFFQDFEGMEDGFRERAQSVQALLHEDATAFVMVSAPRGDTVSEALSFGEKLSGFGFGIAGIISNRHTPVFATGSRSTSLEQALEARDRDALENNLARMELLRSAEDAELSRLLTELEPPRLARVPLLEGDIASIEDLAQMARSLL